MNAGIALPNGVVLEVSKARVWLYDFRNNGCVGFDCMWRCPLWFRMVVGCFSLVLWGLPLFVFVCIHGVSGFDSCVCLLCRN